MLSKCANPSCSASFHYLHEGRLFRMETPLSGNGSVQGGNAARQHNRRLEFFWLCDECATSMTLTYKPGLGVTTQPLAPVPLERVHKIAS